VVYSIGSMGNFKFEEDLVARTPCMVHTFDCTMKVSLSALHCNYTLGGHMLD